MSVTLLSPLGFIWAIPTTMYTHCGFSIHLKNDVGNLVYFRLFGCWSLVFGPTACASLACQRAAAAANRGASGWDCGRGSEHVVTTSSLSVLGLRIRISCARTRMLFLFMPNKQLSKSVPETVPERKGEPQTTSSGTGSKLWKNCNFQFGNPENRTYHVQADQQWHFCSPTSQSSPWLCFSNALACTVSADHWAKVLIKSVSALTLASCA